MDLTITVPAIIAVVALVVGGVTIPIRSSRKAARVARRTQLEPAFDELLQAVARIRDTANTAQIGLKPKIEESWKKDLDFIKSVANGRYPVKSDDTATHQACMNLLIVADRLEDSTTLGYFTEERFNEAVARHVKSPDNPHSGLFRLIEDAIEHTMRRPIVGADIVSKADMLKRRLIEQRDKMIQDG